MEEEVFGKRILPHDRYQFEIKLDYKFSEHLKRPRYGVEVFFFIPTSLDLHQDNYDYKDFYKDVQNYIRFKTPTMSFEYLMDENSAKSPLKRIQDLLDQLLRKPSPSKQKKFIYESKLLACIFRSTLRENILIILDEMTRMASLEKSDLLQRELKTLLSQFSEKYKPLLLAYRALGQKLLSAGLERLREAHQLIDEFLSLAVENFHYQLLEEIQNIPHVSFRKELFPIVQKVILEEEDYRRQRGYLSLLSPENSRNELFLHRYGLIKKFSSNVLYLDLSKKNTRKKWTHFFFAIAAGLAMLFATVVGFYAQQRFPNFSLGLLLTFVIIYMFKDRLKEVFKEVFSSFISRKFYDRRIEIFDPDRDKCVGFCKEKFYYLPFEDLDLEVQKLRKLDTQPGLPIEERGENIFCYKRYIEIFSGPVAQFHSRIDGLNDILRFNVKNMLAKMDEPIQEIPFLQPDSTEISRLSVSKVYHLNVVFRFTIQSETPSVSYERLRVILDQRGIRRIEKISAGGNVDKIEITY